MENDRESRLPDGAGRVLLCMDGMGFQEWYCFKQYLAGYGLRKFNEMAVFALLPTITGISRRALFCAKSKLKELVEEEKGFSQFVRQNWPESRPAGVFINTNERWRREYLSFDYLGLICNLMDDLDHSMLNVQESKEMMQKNLAFQLEKSGLGEMVSRLLEEGYRVYLVSDHGLVWCRGNGYQATRDCGKGKWKTGLTEKAAGRRGTDPDYAATFCSEILGSPQIFLNHLPQYVFNFFDLPDLRIVAQKYNGELWDYQHRMTDDYLIMHFG